jgi:hypothetical protein
MHIFNSIKKNCANFAKSSCLNIFNFKSINTTSPINGSISGLISLPSMTNTNINSMKLSEGYKKWIYKCVNINAFAIAETEWKLLSSGNYKEKSVFTSKRIDKKSFTHDKSFSQSIQYKLMDGSDDFNEIYVHPILSLLQHPNPKDTQYDLFYKIAVNMELFGSAFLLVTKNGGQVRSDGTQSSLGNMIQQLDILEAWVELKHFTLFRGIMVDPEGPVYLVDDQGNMQLPNATQHALMIETLQLSSIRPFVHDFFVARYHSAQVMLEYEFFYKNAKMLSTKSYMHSRWKYLCFIEQVIIENDHKYVDRYVPSKSNSFFPIFLESHHFWFYENLPLRKRPLFFSWAL